MSFRTALVLAVVAAAAALAWNASAELPPAARAWATTLLVLLPPLLVVQARLLQDAEGLSRESIYISSAVSLWVLAGITAAAALTSGWEPAAIGLIRLQAETIAAWAAAITLAGLVLVLAARSLGLEEAPILRFLLPRTGREKLLFLGLSVTAGFCEELVFRGFLLHALEAATGSVVLAVALSSGVFGLLHAYQRPAGAARAAALGAVLAAPVVATGSIVPAVLAHAALDVIAGLLLRERLLR